MYQSFSFIAALFLLPLTASAQQSSNYSQPSTHDRDEPGVSLRIVGGPGLASIGGTGAESPDRAGKMGSALGMNFGIGLEFPSSRLFSILTGVHYIQKGFKLSNNDLEVTALLKMIEVPLQAKLSFGTNARFSIAAGPYLGVGLGTNISAKASRQGVTQSVDFSDGTGSGTLEYGARGSVGVEAPLNHSVSLLLGASYDYSLNSGELATRTLLADLGFGFYL